MRLDVRDVGAAVALPFEAFLAMLFEMGGCAGVGFAVFRRTDREVVGRGKVVVVGVEGERKSRLHALQSCVGMARVLLNVTFQ